MIFKWTFLKSVLSGRQHRNPCTVTVHNKKGLRTLLQLCKTVIIIYVLGLHVRSNSLSEHHIRSLHIDRQLQLWTSFTQRLFRLLQFRSPWWEGMFLDVLQLVQERQLPTCFPFWRGLCIGHWVTLLSHVFLSLYQHESWAFKFIRLLVSWPSLQMLKLDWL